MSFNEKFFKSYSSKLFNARFSRQLVGSIEKTSGIDWDNLDIFESEDAAYKIQEYVAARNLQYGLKIVGRKIGLTSKVIQKKFNFTSPISGFIFDDIVFGTNNTFDLRKWENPLIEGEIAVVLKRDLNKERITIVDIINAIDYVLTAIEIVDSRYEGGVQGVYDIIADNSSNAGVILGARPVRFSDADLENCKMNMMCDGDIVSSGYGRDCLGHPLNALIWLANFMVSRENPLQSGEFIITGALGPAVKVQAGKKYTVSIDGIGEVSANFE